MPLQKPRPERKPQKIAAKFFTFFDEFKRRDDAMILQRYLPARTYEVRSMLR